MQRHFRPKGAVLQAPEDIAIARQEILERNREKGQDTPLEDLL
jgi:sRNA-binding carbon storage regulator CsrA